MDGRQENQTVVAKHGRRGCEPVELAPWLISTTKPEIRLTRSAVFSSSLPVWPMRSKPSVTCAELSAISPISRADAAERRS
jgi:hypothetical protein